MSHPDPHDPDVTVVASVSGGKDSTALSLWLHEQGIDHVRVFADTGWEADETYEYLDKVLEPKLGKIHRVRGERQMEELIRHKKMFPGRLNRYCTTLLKVVPLDNFMDGLDDEVVNAVGIRSRESKKRSALTEWEFAEKRDRWTWRPLIDMTVQEIVEIHHRNGVPGNPLYSKGSTRVGCYPCIFARKKEVLAVYENAPERIDLIRKLEAEVQEGARLRYEARGETFESLGYSPPTYFSISGNKMTVGIDNVVEWSKTAYGGKQFELFTDPSDGCMRWGLCDAAAEE